jgi:hypothetical protein
MCDSNTIKYDCWSENGENYFKDFCTVIDQLEVGDTLYEGVSITPKVTSWIDADRVIEDIQCSACDDCGEYAEDFLNTISNEAKTELKNIITAWVEKYERPTFYLVGQVSERLVNEDDKA